MGPCAKATVTCTLVAKNGKQFTATNACNNPQTTCPRLPGEGYDKCTSICDQQGHAEIQAMKLAGPLVLGAHAYIQGHTWACKDCQEAMTRAGVAAFTIGPPPLLPPPVWDGID
jgi:hypothetical protein